MNEKLEKQIDKVSYSRNFAKKQYIDCDRDCDQRGFKSKDSKNRRFRRKFRNFCHARNFSKSIIAESYRNRTKTYR